MTENSPVYSRRPPGTVGVTCRRLLGALDPWQEPSLKFRPEGIQIPRRDGGDIHPSIIVRVKDQAAGEIDEIDAKESGTWYDRHLQAPAAPSAPERPKEAWDRCFFGATELKPEAVREGLVKTMG